ncbi:hypothetical protein PFLG_01290 [Plasmodium falciparum RAJ116]|uniref:Uncharacterized protein n=1 Tax=Plasmodium falciparum RAJ116 TaxID=580058 RepID=A0A0L0CZ93_PLAFA|nr:hypothetical protein PFLG_01290 [Plasmodium falciparum RAJ116]
MERSKFIHIHTNSSIKNNEGNTNSSPIHINKEHNKSEHIYNSKVSSTVFEELKNLCHEKEKKVNDVSSSHINNQKTILLTSYIKEQNSNNNQDNVMPYNSSNTLFDKIKNSQKISFIKTEEEYINMLKNDEKDNVPINTLNKNSNNNNNNNKICSSNNNVSFADNIFSNNKSYIDNTKIYSEDYINIEKQKSEIFLQDQEKENIMNHVREERKHTK